MFLGVRWVPGHLPQPRRRSSFHAGGEESRTLSVLPQLEFAGLHPWGTPPSSADPGHPASGVLLLAGMAGFETGQRESPGGQLGRPADAHWSPGRKDRQKCYVQGEAKRCDTFWNVCKEHKKPRGGDGPEGGP